MPELDMLIVWFRLETGARQGGAIGLEIGDLDLVHHSTRQADACQHLSPFPSLLRSHAGLLH
ncbi:MAG: hypothetical protein M0Z46_07800 [Actinomycetota bacterium]|nr:hypothetical protein [Actinomycetota bacterium]